MTEKLHDYLYDTRFEVVTDNTPLTYVLSTAKLDATGQLWLAALSNCNCTISYRSDKHNLDADGLSRIREDEQTATIFPDILNTICHSVTMDISQQPYVESLTDVDQEQLDPEEAATIQEEAINRIALSAKDWIQAQSEDRSIRFVTSSLLKDEHVTGAKKNVARPGLEPWVSRLPCEHSNGTDETVSFMLLLAARARTAYSTYHISIPQQGIE